MAKSTSPLTSLKASGTFGRSLTFRAGKGLTHISKKLSQNQHKTKKQIAINAYFAGLSALYEYSKNEINSNFAPVTNQQQQTIKNTFFQYSLNRFQESQFASTSPTPTNNPSGAHFDSAIVKATNKYITLNLHNYPIEAFWNRQVLVNQTGNPPILQNDLAAVTIWSQYLITLGPFTAGKYYFFQWTGQKSGYTYQYNHPITHTFL
jgi:hypothetical protein